MRHGPYCAGPPPPDLSPLGAAGFQVDGGAEEEGGGGHTHESLPQQAPLAGSVAAAQDGRWGCWGTVRCPRVHHLTGSTHRQQQQMYLAPMSSSTHCRRKGVQRTRSVVPASAPLLAPQGADGVRVKCTVAMRGAVAASATTTCLSKDSPHEKAPKRMRSLYERIASAPGQAAKPGS